MCSARSGIRSPPHEKCRPEGGIQIHREAGIAPAIVRY